MRMLCCLFALLSLSSAAEPIDFAKFNLIDLSHSFDGPILNFPLTITGTDSAYQQGFEYTYAISTQTLTQVPLPATLALLGIGLVGLGWSRRKKA